MAEGTESVKTFFEPNDVFADYTILQFCGRGAYGEVYLAEDITRKTIALKVIPILTGSEIWRMELIGLRHYRQSIDDYRSLIEIYHVGETENYFYYTMEAADNLLHGENGEYLADTLAHRLARGGRLAPEKVLELANALLDALDNLSEHDLAHRDLKPANIVFVNGKAKLSDIGLISNTGVCSKIVGTADFLPPELADGDPVGYSNDLYALGKVLYCALTGLLPEHFPEVPVTVPLPVWRQFRPILMRACAADPRQRFYTSGEFRKALPSMIRQASFAERAVEELRYRYSLHPLLWRMCLTSAGLLAAGAMLGGYLHWIKLRDQMREQQEKIDFIFRTIDDLRSQFTHLERLSEDSGKQATCRQLEIVAELAVSARAAGRLKETEHYCIFADTALRQWADETGRSIFEMCPDDLKTLTPVQQEDLLKHCYDFTETPLFQYLSPSSKARLKQLMANLKKIWNPDGKLPTPGETWRFENDEMLDFVYVAQGRLADEPQQSYWIGINEVTVGSFRRVLGLPPGRNDANLPAVNLSWNERLLFCELLNRRAAKAGTLPEGFIYRLPTLQEWSFAFKGGWRSRGYSDYEQRAIGEIAWSSANSDYELHPVKMRSPGLLGLYDMAGNASETALDGGEVILCGASFRDRRVVANIRQESDFDEVESSEIGFRVVLGPGSPDDLSKLWYFGESFTHQTEQSIYELLGGKDTRWDGKTADLWCRLLGGRGACAPTAEEGQRMLQNSRRLRNSTVLAGAHRKGEEWFWSDGTPLKDGLWIHYPNSSSGEERYLVGDHGFWRGISAKDEVPWMMVEWNLDEYRVREKARKAGSLTIPDSPLVEKRFTLHGKDYVLIKAPVQWFAAKRLAELLGAKLAMPEDETLASELLAELEDFKEERIALGGCRFFDKWQWLDGNAGPEMLPVEHDEAADAPPSVVNKFLAFHGGKLCGVERFDALLCEMPTQK